MILPGIEIRGFRFENGPSTTRKTSTFWERAFYHSANFHISIENMWFQYVLVHRQYIKRSEKNAHRLQKKISSFSKSVTKLLLHISVACKICQTVKHLNYYAGMFFLTAMSVDRYIAVAYSTKARQVILVIEISITRLSWICDYSL